MSFVPGRVWRVGFVKRMGSRGKDLLRDKAHYTKRAYSFLAGQSNLLGFVLC